MNEIKIYLLLTLLVLLSSCSERVIVSDADSLGLRCKVKTMDECCFIAFTSFDSIVLRTKIYQHRYAFHYDSRYKSIEKRSFCKSSSDSTSRDLNDGYSARYRYVSDSLTIVDFFDQQDRLMYYINKTYANNRRLSEEKYSASGKPVVKSKFWYNSKNQLQNTTVFYENDRRETYYTYSPGEKFETGEEFNSLYRFDVNGRISSQTTYDGVTFVSVKRFSYDAYGNVTMTLETDKNNHIKKTLYDYVYDFNSNWTLCVEYNYSGNIFVRKRTIIYFS